jgi:CPA2 family monovalent cation:H+ antiporter-2
LAILLAQDLAVAPILVSIGMMSRFHGGGRSIDALLTVVPAALALAVLVIAGRVLLRPLFHSAALARSPDMFAALSLLVVVGAAAAAASVGLSMGIGAFVAGLLLAETEFRREVEVVVEPYKGLLLGMFFVSVGASLKLDRLLGEPWLVLAVTAGVLVVKCVASFSVAGLFGIKARTAAEISLPLGPAGEFAFVVVAQAGVVGLISQDVGDVVAISTGLGLFLIPILVWIGSIVGITRQTADTPDLIPIDEAPEAQRVLVVGYGRVGRLVGDMLRVHHIKFTGIDTDARVVAAGRAAGVRIYFGDAGREAFLKACGVETAAAVVVTMDSPAKVEEVVRTVHALRPDMTLFARARDEHQAELLYRIGVTDAVPEAIEASLQLAENTLVELGVPMGLVIASIHEKRDEFRKQLSQNAAIARPIRAFHVRARSEKSMR